MNDALVSRLERTGKAAALATIWRAHSCLVKDPAPPELTADADRELSLLAAKLAARPNANAFSRMTDVQLVRWFVTIFANGLAERGVDI